MKYWIVILLAFAFAFAGPSKVLNSRGCWENGIAIFRDTLRIDTDCDDSTEVLRLADTSRGIFVDRAAKALYIHYMVTKRADDTAGYRDSATYRQETQCFNHALAKWVPVLHWVGLSAVDTVYTPTWSSTNMELKEMNLSLCDSVRFISAANAMTLHKDTLWIRKRLLDLRK